MKLGKILMTSGVADWKEQSIYNSMFIYRRIERYIDGDYGDLDDHDREVNKYAAERGERVLAAYNLIPEGKL